VQDCDHGVRGARDLDGNVLVVRDSYRLARTDGLLVAQGRGVPWIRVYMRADAPSEWHQVDDEPIENKGFDSDFPRA